MDKKFFISTTVVFVVWSLGGFLVHGLWLTPIYDTMPDIMRPAADAQALMPFMILAHAVMSGAFVWIYQRGNEDKPWLQQGLRFGIAVALLAPIPMFMIYYVVQQETASLAIKQSIGDGVVVIVVALVAAFLNKRNA